MDERYRWEQIVADQDAAREKARAEKMKEISDMGARTGAAPENNSSQSPESDWLANSRGGTRTHDPGIMSAVL